MLGKVNSGRGCLWLGTLPTGICPWTIGPGGVPDTGTLPGRPPVGAVKIVELANPGLSGGLGGNGGFGRMGIPPGLGGALGRGRDGPTGRWGDGGRGAVRAPSVVPALLAAGGLGELRAKEH